MAYRVDKRLVRGLDYYTRTTFEIQTGALGAQSAVAGGGRYDGLVQALGGPDQPAIGFAIGFDRLAEIVGLNPADLIRPPDLFMAALGEKSQQMAFDWMCALGRQGVRAEIDYGDRSLKSQMKRADKLSARYVLIIGEQEVAQGNATLRNMATRDQLEIPLERLVETVRETIRP